MNSLKVLVGIAVALSLAQVQAVERYYVTKSGTKYHLTKSCSGLKNAKHVTDVTMSAIRGKKLTLCEICKEQAKKSKAKPKNSG